MGIGLFFFFFLFESMTFEVLIMTNFSPFCRSGTLQLITELELVELCIELVRLGIEKVQLLV